VGRGRKPWPWSAPAFTASASKRARADFVFLSPVFPTRSHPGAAALGPIRFGLLARGTHVPVIALGGMDPRRAQRLEKFNVYGWAGIDAWGIGSV
jgi:thiamine-phosphate pyrophosphorylase